MASTIQRVSERTRRVSRLAHTIQNSQDCSDLPLPAPVTCQDAPSTSSVLSTQLESNMDLLQSALSHNLAESLQSESEHLDSYLVIVTTIEQWLRVVEYRVLKSCQLTTEQAVLEYQCVSKDLDLVQSFCEQLKEVTHSLASRLENDKDLQKNVLLCLQVICHHLTAVTSLTKAAHERTSQDNQRARNLQEEMLQLEKSVSAEVQSLEEVCNAFAGEEELPVVQIALCKVEGIQEEVAKLRRRYLDLQLLRPTAKIEAPDASVPLVDLTSLEAKLRILHRQMACRKQDPGFRQQRFLSRKYSTLLDTVRELSSAGRLSIQMDPFVVTQPEHLKAYLSQTKVLFQSLHIQCQRLQSTYALLEELSASRLNRQHQCVVSEAHSLLEQWHTRRIQLTRCLEDWLLLLPLLDDAEKWLKDLTTRSANQEPISRINLQNLVSQAKDKRDEVERHLPQLYALLTLQGRLSQSSVFCPVLERRMEQCQQHWQLMSNQISLEVKELSSYLDQWQCFQGSLESFRKWLENATSTLEQLQSLSIDRDEQSTISILLKRIIDVRKLQSEQQRQELPYKHVEESLDLCQRMGLHDPTEARELRQELSDQWKCLTDGLKELEENLCQFLKQQISTMPGFLEEDLLAWPTKQRHAMDALETAPSDTFDAVELKLAKFMDMEDELKTILIIFDYATCHCSSLLSARDETTALLQEANITSNQLQSLLDQWKNLEKDHQGISDFMLEAETSLSIAKEALNVPIRLEHAQRETDRIESLHQEIQAKQQDLKYFENQSEKLILGTDSSSLKEQVQEFVKCAQVRWNGVQSLVYEVRLALTDKLRDWDHYKDLVEAVNRLLDEVGHATENSKVPVSFLEQTQLNHTQLQQCFEELNESVPLLVSLENASLKLRGNENSTTNLQVDLQNEYISILQRWQSQETLLSTLCSQQQDLSNSWSTLDTNLSEINNWVATTLAQLQLLDCGRLDDEDIAQLENLKLGISQHGQSMRDAKNLTQVLCQSGLLSAEGCNQVRAVTENTSNSLARLQRALMSKLGDVSKADKQLELHHSTAQRIQDCFQTMQEQVLSADIPSDPKAKTTEIEVTETAMNKLVTCEMDLVLLKDFLSQQRYPDSALATQVVCLLAIWQELRTKVCYRHSHLVRSSSTSPFASKCQGLMAIFLQLRSVLSKSVPCHYAEIVKEMAELRMLELQMNSHESILESVLAEGSELVRSCLLTGLTDQQKQMIRYLEELQLEWSAMSEILSQRLELLEHLIVLWRRCTKARHSLQDWTKEAKAKGGLPSVGEQLLEPDTLEAIAEEEDRLENLLSSWPCSENLSEELNTSSESLVNVLDARTAESVVLNKCSLLDELESLRCDLDRRRKHLQHFRDRRRSLDDDLGSLQRTLLGIMEVPDPNRPSLPNQQAEDLSECEERLHSVSECQGSLSALESRLSHLEDHLSSGDWHLLRDRHNTLSQVSEACQAKMVMSQQTLLRDVERRQLFGQGVEVFLSWIRTAEQKIIESQEQPLQDRVKLLEKLQSEIQDRTSSLSHLSTKGRALLAVPTSSDEQPDDPVLDQLNGLTQSWQRMNNNLQERLEAAKKTERSLRNLKEKLECFSSFVQEKEKLLEKSVWFYQPNREEIEKKVAELMTIRDEITAQNSKMEQMVILFQELESSVQMSHDKSECRSIKKKMFLVQERYQKLFGLATDRDIFYQETLDEWNRFHTHISQMERWLDEQEKLGNEHRTLAHLYNIGDTAEELKLFEGLMQNLQKHAHLTEKLTSQFCCLSNASRLDGSGMLSSQFRAVLARWDAYAEKCKLGLRRLRHSMQVWEDFQTQREDLMVWLTELDMKVTRVLVSGSLNRVQKVEELEACKDELQQHEMEVRSWEGRAVHLQQRNHSDDAVRCESEVAELQTYWDEIDARIRECILLMAPSGVSSDEVDGSPDEDFMSETPVTEQTPISREGVGNLVTQSSASTSSSVFPSSDVTDIESLPSNTDEASSSGGAVSQSVTDEAGNSLCRELEAALTEAEIRLSALDDSLQCPTPEAYEHDTSSMDFACLLAACHSTMDVVQHLSDTAPPAEGKRYQSSVDSVSHQWEVAQSRALEKENRFRAEQTQWRDVQTGLIQLETWLVKTEELISEDWTDTPEDVHKLEELIRRHKEFLSEMGHMKKVEVSVHHLGSKFTCPRRERHRSQPEQPLELNGQLEEISPEAELLRSRLQGISGQLERICIAAIARQNTLQMALLQCSEFENMVAELSSWLDDREHKARLLADVDVQDKDVASIHFNKFLELMQDLGQFEPRVGTLEATYAQLFVSSDDETGKDVVEEKREDVELVEEEESGAVGRSDAGIKGREMILEARAQLASLVCRLRLLHQFCAEQVNRFRLILGESEIDPEKIHEERSHMYPLASAPNGAGGANGAVGGQQPEREGSALGRYYRYMMRVARASLPIQALMLLLLGVASLVPMAEEDFSCILTNNFARSFDPMLRYPNGPPPI